MDLSASYRQNYLLACTIFDTDSLHEGEDSSDGDSQNSDDVIAGEENAEHDNDGPQAESVTYLSNDIHWEQHDV